MWELIAGVWELQAMEAVHCLEVVTVEAQRLGSHLTYSMMELSNQKSISDKHIHCIMTSMLQVRIGHFRVPKCFTFKTRLSVKPLLWK